MTGAELAGFERLLQRQLQEVGRIAREVDDPREALAAILRSHLTFTCEAGERLAAWREQFRNVATEQAFGLRRLQRLYVEEWVNVVVRLRPELSDAEAHAAVHGAMSLLQSAAARRSGLLAEEVDVVLCGMAFAALSGPDSSDSVLT